MYDSALLKIGQTTTLDDIVNPEIDFAAHGQPPTKRSSIGYATHLPPKQHSTAREHGARLSRHGTCKQNDQNPEDRMPSRFLGLRVQRYSIVAVAAAEDDQPQVDGYTSFKSPDVREIHSAAHPASLEIGWNSQIERSKLSRRRGERQRYSPLASAQTHPATSTKPRESRCRMREGRLSGAEGTKGFPDSTTHTTARRTNRRREPDTPAAQNANASRLRTSQGSRSNVPLPTADSTLSNQRSEKSTQMRRPHTGQLTSIHGSTSTAKRRPPRADRYLAERAIHETRNAPGLSSPKCRCEEGEMESGWTILSTAGHKHAPTLDLRLTSQIEDSEQMA
ncbi:hypothetical protein DFP72DRAFT_1045001 [Ephemerocybe angulata]|uniref:Uncharacterized protein n=1 Tax=Ephemerocybe angulata TaxID=980116 RepID=A0A8H6I308_9AGAR|nr:hypothetical protein DFP72DRAFT_1045001 [Tulosesus angulatus]